MQRCVRHQLESYNHFVKSEIQKTIDMFNPVNICSEHDYNKEVNKYALEILITFKNFSIYRPQIHENNGATKLMFPQEAVVRAFRNSYPHELFLGFQFPMIEDLVNAFPFTTYKVEFSK